MRSRYPLRSASSALWVIALALALPASCSEAPEGTSSDAGPGGGATAASSTGEMGEGGCGRTAPPPPLDFAPSTSCAPCHQGIYYDWASSTHAASLTSPVMIAMTNQVHALEGLASPDRERSCVTCHGPLSARYAKGATLPFTIDGCDAPAGVDEGIGCVSCHAYRGDPRSSEAAAPAFLDHLDPSGALVGPLSDPAQSRAHASEASPLFSASPEALCKSCHDVALDIDDNGKIEKGIDLILASTSAEYEAYLQKGGKESCIGCHMPTKPGVTRASEAAGISAPDRVVHDHRFVGVGYKLDQVAENDPQGSSREALLKGAATVVLSNGALKGGTDLSFDASIKNEKAGHNIPTGFTFLRQMWLEVRVFDGDHRELISSGALRTSQDDLCDAATMTDAIQFFVYGCLTSDPELVNFQEELIDRIDVLRDDNKVPVLGPDGEVIPIKPFKAEETWLPQALGGVVSRARPRDKQALTPLAPGESRTFGYGFKLVPQGGPVTIEARLFYRSLPPYIVRRLASKAPPEEASMRPYIKDIQAVEMSQAGISIPVMP